MPESRQDWERRMRRKHDNPSKAQLDAWWNAKTAMGPGQGSGGAGGGDEGLGIPIRSDKLPLTQGSPGNIRSAVYHCGNCGASWRGRPGPEYRRSVEAHKADCHGDTKEHDEEEAAQGEDPARQEPDPSALDKAPPVAPRRVA